MTPIVSVSGLTKRYGGVVALDGLNLEVASGAIHAVVGENGAGKSTLMKVLAGVVKPDAGAILFDGTRVAIDSPCRRAPTRRRHGLTRNSPCSRSARSWPTSSSIANPCAAD